MWLCFMTFFFRYFLIDSWLDFTFIYEYNGAWTFYWMYLSLLKKNMSDLRKRKILNRSRFNFYIFRRSIIKVFCETFPQSGVIDVLDYPYKLGVKRVYSIETLIALPWAGLLSSTWLVLFVLNDFFASAVVFSLSSCLILMS